MLFNLESSYISDVPYNYNSIESIEMLNSAKLNYDYFFEKFMLPNVPCLIRNISSNWECTKLWITDFQEINTEYLQNTYGNESVCVHDCEERYYNSQKHITVDFKDYIKEVQYSDPSSPFPKGKYLKNWHLKLNHKNDNFYEVPIFFASDWLNEFFIENTSDDYRFVYMGPDKTWTPFHVDVFTSYSWSVNVCGQKRWLLFPPGEEEHLRDKLGNLPYDVMTETSLSDRKYFEVIQNAGEAIFVPSGWHHEVWNVGDTISVNHNWINGCNIGKMFDSLLSNLCDIKKEIEHCRDMDDFDQHCQLMLNSLFGMDFKTFYDFLVFIATKRIKMINDDSLRTLFHGHKIGLNHIIFDLNAIKKVLEKFLTCEEVKTLGYFNKIDKTPERLLEDIIAALNS